MNEIADFIIRILLFFGLGGAAVWFVIHQLRKPKRYTKDKADATEKFEKQEEEIENATSNDKIVMFDDFIDKFKGGKK